MASYYANSGSAIDDQINFNRGQVNDLTYVMQQNIEKAMNRDINLNNLQRNIDDLNYQANDFQSTAVKTKKWYIWKNTKWTIILVVTVVTLILLIILIIGLAVGLSMKKN